MLAIDYQLKKCGCAGNNAVIALHLDRSVPVDVFAGRLSGLVDAYPMLCARLKRQFMTRLPYWEVCEPPVTMPKIATLYGASNEDIAYAVRMALNRPLHTLKGENLRFDLLSLPDNRQVIIMTWAHMLMDAHGAEHLLALLGHDDQSLLPVTYESDRFAGCYSLRLRAEYDRNAFREHVNKAFAHIDVCAQRPPLSLYMLHRSAVNPGFDYELVMFTADETRMVRAQARRFGVLNETAYYSGAVVHALYQLYAARGIKPESYVVMVNSDTRKKGACQPLFSTQAASIMYQFLPEDCERIDKAVGAFIAQTKCFVRDNLFDASLAMAEYVRYVPDWLYIKKMGQAFRGEFATAVITYTGDPAAQLHSFMGSCIEYFYHVPSVLTPPGLGVLFSAYAGALTITIVYAEGLLTHDEAISFLALVRALLVKENITH